MRTCPPLVEHWQEPAPLERNKVSATAVLLTVEWLLNIDGVISCVESKRSEGHEPKAWDGGNEHQEDQ